jgi:hypothetical protein
MAGAERAAAAIIRYGGAVSVSRTNYHFTSESVSEGHPDKVCDRISDTVVDAYLSVLPEARVACEALATTNRVVVAGEVRGPEAVLDRVEALTREVIARGADPDLPAAIIDNATRPNQRVVVDVLATLAAKAREAALSGPSIIIVGTVVTLRDRLAPGGRAPSSLGDGGQSAASGKASGTD